VRPDGTPITVEAGQFIGDYKDVKDVQRGTFATGFDFNALNALRNIINFDHHVFRYYGSETEPPCNEHIEWFVFAQPRAASKAQIAQFKDQLTKIRGDFLKKI
jgi:carbonic anhydrase